MPKLYICSGCGQQHMKPTGKNCQFMEQQDTSFSDSNVIVTSREASVNQDIISALQSVSSRLSSIEQCISKTKENLAQKPSRPTGLETLETTPAAGKST